MDVINFDIDMADYKNCMKKLDEEVILEKEKNSSDIISPKCTQSEFLKYFHSRMPSLW